MTKHFISYSGGLSSAVSAIAAAEAELDFELVFADTLIEDEDLYRFNDDLERALGVKITRLCDGRTPWDVFRDERFVGNSRIAPCSKILKTRQVRAYLDESARPDDPLIIGMNLDEEDRLERAQAAWSPRPVRSFLIEMKLYKPLQMEMLKRHGLKPPRLYSMGFLHNNCGGFCVRAGLTQAKLLLQEMPERYAYHEREQERVAREVPGARPFLVRTENGQRQYMTLREFREDVELGEPTPDFDFGGCGCFTTA